MLLLIKMYYKFIIIINTFIHSFLFADPEEEEVIEKRAACRCDSDGPSVSGNSLSGTVDFWHCNEGWKKCVNYYTVVASCCVKKA
jgi:hypothetical protein